MDLLVGFGLGSKKTSEAGVWVDDDAANACLICRAVFSFTNRKHHCRQCGRIVCDPCSQNRKFLESSRTGAPKRVCKQCFQRGALAEEEDARKEVATVAAAEATAAEVSAMRRAASVRLPEVPMDEAVAALKDFPFEGQWDFNVVFMQVDLGKPGSGGAAEPPATTAAALSTFASKSAKAGSTRTLGRIEPVRVGSKALVSLHLKTKGGAYFQGECHDFGQFGQEGKVTGAVQRSNGKVSATIQMIARGPSQAVTTSFNFVGFVNKEGVYSGTFSACEISKAAGSCSGVFKAQRVEDDEDATPAAEAPAAAPEEEAPARKAVPSSSASALKKSAKAPKAEEEAPAAAAAPADSSEEEVETEEERRARRRAEKEKEKRRAERRAAKAAAAAAAAEAEGAEPSEE